MMNNIQKLPIIRKANMHDVKTIYEMLLKLAAYHNEEDKVTSSIEDLIEYGFSVAPQFKCLIAEIDNIAVGMIIFFETYSTWRGKMGIYVQDLYVSDNIRGTGLGEKLLKTAARIGFDHKCNHLRLSVDIGNLVGQKFYKKNGMSWIKSELTYSIQGKDFSTLVGV